MNICAEIHTQFQNAERHSFPFNVERLPRNGIYLLFEKGERGHGCDRIVRVGSHTGENQLRSRLQQHFINENKDRSIFRKNIGRAMLNNAEDPFIEQWEWDLTSRKNREKYHSRVDFTRQEQVEEQVTAYMQRCFSFVVFEVSDKERRLDLESRLISTVSLCSSCRPSDTWLGIHSPKNKIRESGLWLVNHLYKSSLREKDYNFICTAFGHS